jgi:16S rRNA (cytosine967-C5)-methyltransferase
VTEEGAFSGVMLAAELSSSKLSARDRQFAADLVYGTLRRRIPIDRVIEGASSRALESVDPPALALLRMGTYQLLFTRVPPHAAVSETVGLAPPSLRAFVNAVLRKVSASSPEPPTGDDDRAVSLRTGLAEWAVQELRRLLPDAEVEPAAAALATPAALSLRANRCRTTPDRLAARLTEVGFPVTRGAHHPDVLSIGAAAPALLPGYEEGWFTVQDEASALIASALRAAPGERILDACAAPGGKATHLACLASGGLVVAADARLGRAELVRRAASRLGAPLALLVQDARRPALREGSFEAILVDAPCSGVGSARRRPELLWRRDRGELSRLARLQVAILMGIADLIRPGGRLVYSVCTFPRAETDAVVRAFLAKRTDFLALEVPGPDGPAQSHRLWPHRHGTDAMFYAGLRRRG